jgi:hypothetical protein
VNEFQVKDSGQRAQFGSGMVRDVTDGKPDYSLVFDGPMFERWAVHLTKGAAKYSKRNWMQADGEAELARFKESACRHFVQWMRGDVDEDHAAALFFNVSGVEYVKARRERGAENEGGAHAARMTCAPDRQIPETCTTEAVGQFGWTVPDDQKMGLRKAG